LQGGAREVSVQRGLRRAVLLWSHLQHRDTSKWACECVSALSSVSHKSVNTLAGASSGTSSHTCSNAAHGLAQRCHRQHGPEAPRAVRHQGSRQVQSQAHVVAQVREQAPLLLFFGGAVPKVNTEEREEKVHFEYELAVALWVDKKAAIVTTGNPSCLGVRP